MLHTVFLVYSLNSLWQMTPFYSLPARLCSGNNTQKEKEPSVGSQQSADSQGSRRNNTSLSLISMQLCCPSCWETALASESALTGKAVVLSLCCFFCFVKLCLGATSLFRLADVDIWPFSFHRCAEQSDWAVTLHSMKDMKSHTRPWPTSPALFI